MFELCFEIIRRKLDRYIINKYTKIICSLEDNNENNNNNITINENNNHNNHNNNKKKKENYYNLNIGTKIIINNNNINNINMIENKEVKLNIFAIDNSLTIYLGYCYLSYSLSSKQQKEQREDYNNDNEDEIKVSYIIDSNENRIGKIYFTSTICKLYSNENSSNKVNSKSKRSKNTFFEGSKRDIIPSFRFQRLGKKVNWDRIQSLNIERVTKLNDISLLMTCLDDAAIGDVSQEDVDPRFYQAIQLTQFSVQYLLGCQQLLNQRTELIQDAFNVFESEEEELDFQIAKLKARNKALERESEDLDEMTLQYTELLETLDPSSAKKYKRREKVAQAALEYEKLKNSEQYTNFLAHQRKGHSKPNKKKNNSKKSTKKYISDDESDVSNDVEYDSNNNNSNAGRDKLNIQHKNKRDWEDDNDDDSDNDKFIKRKQLSLQKTKNSLSKYQKNENSKQQNLSQDEENITRKLTIQSGSSQKVKQSNQTDYFDNNQTKNETQFETPSSKIKIKSSSSKSLEQINIPNEVLKSHQNSSQLSPSSTSSSSTARSVKDETLPYIQSKQQNSQNNSSDESIAEEPQLKINNNNINNNNTNNNKFEVNKSSSSISSTKKNNTVTLPLHPSTKDMSINLDQTGKSTYQITLTDGFKTHGSFTTGTGNMSVDSLAGDSQYISYDNTYNETNQEYQKLSSLEIKQDNNENTEEITILSPHISSQFNQKRSNLDDNNNDSYNNNNNDINDFNDQSSELDIYLPLQSQENLSQNKNQNKNLQHQHQRLSQQQKDDIDIDINVNENDGDRQQYSTISTTGDNKLQSEVLKFIQQEANSDDINQSPNIKQTFRSKGNNNNDSDDVLLGTNLLHTYTDTVSSFNSNAYSPNRNANSPILQDQSSAESLLLKSQEIRDEFHENEEKPNETDQLQVIKWNLGRAPLELIETAIALDVFVSAVRFDSSRYSSSKIRIQFEFMETLSEMSEAFQTNVRMSLLPVSYGAYISFNREASLLLADEISSRMENLCLIIRILEETKNNSKELNEIGDAIVELWIMIEDSCSIVRQEIDICELDSGVSIGSAVVDVRGHHLLSRCS